MTIKRLLSPLVLALCGVGFLSASISTQGPQLAPAQYRVAVPRDPASVPKGLAKSDWHSIRAAYEAGRHAFQPIEGGWQARNPGQQWTTKFDGRGFLTEPRDGGWQWGLELKSYGFGENQRAIGGTPSMKADGLLLTYRWDATVQEWFVNDQRGLEHGFTIAERPDAPLNSRPSILNLVLFARGTLHPRVSADGQGVLFQDASGATMLNYTGLKVWDADGKALASHFEAAEENAVRLLVEEGGARYPLTIDPIAQQANLKPAAVGTSQSGDKCGYSVAVSGDTVIIGAPIERSSATGVDGTPDESANASGAAYVFVRSGATWTQQAYLKPAAVGTTQTSDRFGFSVAVSGDTIVVGAPDEDSSTRGIDSIPNESASASGAAYVFVRSGATWTQQAYLKPAVVGTSQAGDQFGYSVAVSGDTVLVGAPNEDSSTTGVGSTPNENGPNAGAAYVFVRSGVTWAQQAYLKPAVVGTTQTGDQFGFSVAVSGDTVLVGAPNEDSSTTGIGSTPNESASASGAAYVFAHSGVAWAQQAYLKPAVVGTTQANDQFGYSVAVSGDTLAIGAPNEDSSSTGVGSTPNESASASGAAYIFARGGVTWTEQAYLKPALVGTSQSSDQFGYSVAISDDTVAIGAINEDSNTTGINTTPNQSAVDAGAACVFVRFQGTWAQQAFLKPAAFGSTQSGDQFGWSVAVSGETVVVGAINEDSSTLGVNSTPNESSLNSGAAYVFIGFVPAAAPEIAVEQPVGVSFIVGSAFTDFGRENVGSSGAARIFTVRNTGTADLALNSIVSTSGEFILNTIGTSTTVPPGNSTTFEVVFAPSVIGLRSGTLQIASDDGDESFFQILLNGIGQTTPTVTTPTSTSINASGARLGGTVTATGGAAISEHGVVYAVTATNANPVVGGPGVAKVTATGPAGPFTISVSGLRASTDYTFKAYATNSAGSGYSIPGTFTTSAAAPGDLDSGFGAGGKVMTPVGTINDFAYGVAVQSDRKILVTGYSRGQSTDYDIALLRYTDDGVLDDSFGIGGKVIVDLGQRDDRGESVAVQSDGKILVAGYSRNANIKSDFALLRYTTSGTLDSGFGTGGIVTTAIGSVYDYGYSLAVQGDGKILVAGTTLNANFNYDFALVRYNSDGTLDSGFGAGGIVTTPAGSGNSVAVQSDGKILVAGSSNSAFALIRYTIDGALDNGFGTAGIVTTAIGSSSAVGSSMALQIDGKILVAGSSTSGGNSDFALVRYHADGTLDSGFGTAGIVTTPIGIGNDSGQSVAVQSGGKILVAGYARIGSYDNFVLVRYNLDGSLDGGFGTSGIVTTEVGDGISQGHSMALQSDSEIVVAGFYSAQNSYAFTLVRHNGGSLGDIDGDGLLDGWELTYWPTIAGHSTLDDFDHDGYVELLELALGLNPALPNAAGLPAATNEGGYLTITLTKQSGVTYEAQSAGTLLPALPDSFGAASTTLLIDNATTFKARDNFLIGTPPSRYLRLKVTAAP